MRAPPLPAKPPPAQPRSRIRQLLTVSNTTIGRREFFHRAALASALGLVGSGVDMVEAATARPLAVSLNLAAQDQTVLAWLRGFASQIRLVGAGVFSRLRGDADAAAHWLAAVPDLAALGEIFSSAPFAGLYTSGSTLFFTIGGREVSIELLPVEAFSAKLNELARAKVKFDHDSLVYDPETGRLTDPLRSKGTRGLRLRRGDADNVRAFAVVMSGLVESHRLHLPLGAGFKRLRNRVLRANGSKPEVAERVCAELFARLVTWTGLAPRAEIEFVLKSRLVSSSVRTAMGLEVRAAVASVNATLGGDQAPNPQAWVAALGASDPQSKAAGWLRNGSRFDQLRTHAIL